MANTIQRLRKASNDAFRRRFAALSPYLECEAKERRELKLRYAAELQALTLKHKSIQKVVTQEEDLEIARIHKELNAIYCPDGVCVF